MTDAEALLMANHGVWPEHPECDADCGWGTDAYDGTVHSVGLAMREADAIIELTPEQMERLKQDDFKDYVRTWTNDMKVALDD